jgi:regulator of protease activity HflC (stomatin/prohibitin superfamily)
MNSVLIALGLLFLIAAGALLAGTLQRRSPEMTIGAGVAALVGLVCIVLGFTIVSVGPNERLVIFNRVTGDLADVREPGISLVNPITTDYRHYDVSRQTYTMSSIQFEGDIQGDDAVSARTSGGQEVLIDLTMIYRITPEDVNRIHVNWPNSRYRDELIRPLLRSVVRDAVSIFPIESVYQERATIDNQITEAVIPAMEREGFTVEDILVRNVTFAPDYASAIEAAQIAEVNIREQEFRVREVEQEAAQTEARARGVAEARIIEAQADAEALRLVAEVLAENPNLLQYEYIQRLSDQVQLIALPANSPFIFDLQGISNLPQPGSPGGQSIIPSPDDD